MPNVIGHHRSLALAERHLRELSRKNPGVEVRIASRRDSEGRFSNRGRTFIFEIKEPTEPPKEETEEIELVGGFDSPGRKRK